MVIYKDGKLIKNISQFIGYSTNNIAEYTALIFALQEALIQKATDLKVHTDSELLFKQIKKIYKIKNHDLKVLMLQVEHMISGFKNFDIEHISRDKNKNADRLADKAIKQTIRQDVFNF